MAARGCPFCPALGRAIRDQSMSARDQELLGQAADGDQDALVELLQRHGPDLRHRLAGKIPDRWQSLLTADDVMQQTYTDAFLDIGRFRPQGPDSFVHWLNKLADRNLLDAIRMLEADKRGGGRECLRPAALDDSFLSLYELLGKTTITPSREAARHEAKTAIERTIPHLPEPYRVVIQMYDLEERPLQDVASALKRSHGAVLMLRARAHNRLRQLLGSASDFLSGSA